MCPCSCTALVQVTRIHNRFLRNRFEDHLESVVDTSDSSYKRALEYLFYGEDPECPGEILRALQEGFQPAAAYEALGKDAGIPLSNSVFLCEEARIKDCVRRQGLGKRGMVRGRALVRGYVW